MASDRAARFADKLASANAEAIEFTRSCTAEEWSTVVPGEEWTVGVVLHHIAESHDNGLRWLTAMASGNAVTDSAESIDEKNVAHADRASNVGQAETAELLASSGAQLEAFLRNLTDDELDRTVPFGPAGGRPLPTDALAAVAAGHVRDHLAHARAAVSRP
jgi:hypothetical protein